MNTFAVISPDAPVADVTGPGLNLLDALFEAQDNIGQVTWIELTRTVAKGTFVRAGVTPVSADELGRVAVVDTENADAREAIAAALWVAERR